MTVFKSFLELLPVLADNSYFLPYHESFEYHHVTGKKSRLAMYPPFHPTSLDVRCPMRNIVWHNQRLHISLHIGIPGSVELRDQSGVKPEHLGLTRNYPAQIFRTYQLVRDGHYHVKQLPVAFDGPEGRSLQNALADLLTELSKDTFSLNVSKLPIAYDDGSKIDLEQLCLDYREEVHLQAELKMLKYVCHELFPIKRRGEITLGEMQRDFLILNGIRPETGTAEGANALETGETETESDHFHLHLEMEHFSSLPVSAIVWQQYRRGEKLTPAAKAMALVLRDVDLLLEKVGGTPEQIHGYFQPRIEKLHRRMRVQHAKVLEKKFLAFSKGQIQEEKPQKLTVDGDAFLLVARNN